jgi:hypothetical protein
MGNVFKAKPPAPKSAISITSITHLSRIDVSTQNFSI